MTDRPNPRVEKAGGQGRAKRAQRAWPCGRPTLGYKGGSHDGPNLGRGVAGAADAARVVNALANVALADPLLIKLLLEEKGPRAGSLLVRIENPSAKASRDGQVNVQAHPVEGGGVSETGVFSRLRLVDPWDRRFGAELQDLTGSEEVVDQGATD